MYLRIYTGVKNDSPAYLGKWQHLETAGKQKLGTAIEEPSCFEGSYDT